MKGTKNNKINESIRTGVLLLLGGLFASSALFASDGEANGLLLEEQTTLAHQDQGGDNFSLEKNIQEHLSSFYDQETRSSSLDLSATSPKQGRHGLEKNESESLLKLQKNMGILHGQADMAHQVNKLVKKREDLQRLISFMSDRKDLQGSQSTMGGKEKKQTTMAMEKIKVAEKMNYSHVRAILTNKDLRYDKKDAVQHLNNGIQQVSGVDDGVLKNNNHYALSQITIQEAYKQMEDLHAFQDRIRSTGSNQAVCSLKYVDGLGIALKINQTNFRNNGVLLDNDTLMRGVQYVNMNGEEFIVSSHPGDAYYPIQASPRKANKILGFVNSAEESVAEINKIARKNSLGVLVLDQQDYPSLYETFKNVQVELGRKIDEGAKKVAQHSKSDRYAKTHQELLDSLSRLREDLHTVEMNSIKLKKSLDNLTRKIKKDQYLCSGSQGLVDRGAPIRSTKDLFQKKKECGDDYLSNISTKSTKKVTVEESKKRVEAAEKLLAYEFMAKKAATQSDAEVDPMYQGKIVKFNRIAKNVENMLSLDKTYQDSVANLVNRISTQFTNEQVDLKVQRQSRETKKFAKDAQHLSASAEQSFQELLVEKLKSKKENNFDEER